jgi:hypothetical protein
MTEPQHAVIARLSTDFAALSQQIARIAGDLTELDRILAARPAPQPPVAPPVTYPPPYWQPAPPPPPPPAVPVQARRRPRSEGWIGKVLAVAGVGVTLIGVVLLLVLAAQAGILRPQIRVAAGAVLAGALVAAAVRLSGRPGGRVGAIALAATGIAAAYIDVIAITTIYAWVPAAVGLVAAAAIGGGGLTLARRWNSEHLGVLVFVPLILLAPIVTDGVTLLLVAFMLALSAATLLIEVGKAWTYLHGVRTAAPTLPLLIALMGTAIGAGDDAWLAGACAIAAALALIAALIVLPRNGNRVAVALIAATGTLPLLCVSLAVDQAAAALMITALAGTLLAVVLVADRLPGVAGAVARIWGALSAVAALIAVTVAFDGEIAAPVLLSMAAVVAVAGRRDEVARWSALGFAFVGAGLYVAYAPPGVLATATPMSGPDTATTLISSVLLTGAAVAIVAAWVRGGGIDADTVRVLWSGAAVVSIYAVTTFTVTAGVLIGGAGRGFYAGHMVATICWIAVAAGLFGYAARLPKADRSLPIGGGLALVAAATAKLFLFDLGTLDGIFRVAVFIVVGLILLGMGAGYARLLAQQDQQDGTPIAR